MKYRVVITPAIGGFIVDVQRPQLDMPGQMKMAMNLMTDVVKEMEEMESQSIPDAAESMLSEMTGLEGCYVFTTWDQVMKLLNGLNIN